MFFGLHLLTSEDLFDDALFVNHKGGTNSAHRLLTLHRLFAPGTHRLHQCLVDIGYQWEWQLVLLLELHMRGCRVLAHAHHFVACILQFFIVVPQTTSLCCTSTGVVLLSEG